MKKRGTYYVGTLLAFRGAAGMVGKGLLQPSSEKKAREAFEAWGVGLNRAYKAGVKIALGTDAGVYPHGDNAHQFHYMVQYGMTPAQAIQAATVHAADLIGRSSDVGELTPGHFADLIAVPADPLQHVESLEHVAFVMKGGAIVRDDRTR